MATYSSIVEHAATQSRMDAIEPIDLFKKLKLMSKDYNLFLEMGLSSEWQRVDSITRKGKMVIFKSIRNKTEEVKIDNLKYFLKNFQFQLKSC